jgi:hypothetical protein
MGDALRDHHRLAGPQVEHPVLQVDDKPARDDIKELVFIIVFVPVILTLNDTQADHRVVGLAEGLVEPLVSTVLHNDVGVDQLQRVVENVEAGLVGKGR